MRTAPLSKNLPVPVLPGCCANTRGIAAMAVAAAPVFSILRLIGSILGVLMTFSRLTTLGDRRASPQPTAAALPVSCLLQLQHWRDDSTGLRYTIRPSATSRRGLSFEHNRQSI